MESRRTLPSLTDDLLQEIFVRIGSPADLARASIACVAFRRLIADPTFLRRYRSLHRPQLLCLLDRHFCGFQPAETPHPSAALAAAVVRAADFSADSYIPGGSDAWCTVSDIREGRVLISCNSSILEGKEYIFIPLAVCDPLARRCLLLPPIPDDLLASVQVQKQDFLDCDEFLVPSRDEEDETSFRVVVRADFTEMVVAFFFSSASGHWSVGASLPWDALSIPLAEHRLLSSHTSYVYGCFYWKVPTKNKSNKWLKLDMSSMEMSAVELPSGQLHDGCLAIVVEAGEGRLGMFSLIKGDNATSLFYTIRQIGGERSDQLEMDNVIPLPKGFRYHIFGPYEGHISIQGYQLLDEADNMCFMLEIETLKIERVCRMRFGAVYPYFGFPPSMSESRI
ncbi:hypothetical protein U9M48_037436 [Paspalum notatum var. saurae]|uniref:F-box domain-containing protein n=1 Tax=Paspalum notatum var. saurae TaxID=547442 RepID=A0AAQ3UL76_PASNO